MSPPYPDAPWRLRGSLWLSLMHLPERVDDERPAGLYGLAFLSYDEPSPLVYAELLAARPVRVEDARVPRVRITDIWVDSPASEAGGRALWAIPKGLATFERTARSRGPVSTTHWSASIEGQRVASARFADVGALAPRLPVRAGTDQPALPESGGPRCAPITGSARVLPARARWDLAPDGPLGWLAGARQLASVRATGFRLSFG